MSFTIADDAPLFNFAHPSKNFRPYNKSSDPFLMPPQSVISFSGGRTSACMLWEILQRHDGKLPNECVVLFCNTGRERPETLDFVQACEQHWAVPIVWLEWRRGSPGFAIVGHNSACRDGSVFDDLVTTPIQRRDKTHGRRPLPNPVSRVCTTNLKIRVKIRYVRQVMGWKTFDNYVGFRADEAVRVHRSPNNTERGETIHAPLFDANVDESGIMDFWAKQPFDLRLKSHEGNCDLCFMKSRKKLNAILRDRPDLADWWIAAEEAATASDRPSLFHSKRPTYRAMRDAVQDGTATDFGEFDDEFGCASHGCTD